jgi:hypothetical protein
MLHRFDNVSAYCHRGSSTPTPTPTPTGRMT